jgi:hypothetical protein
MPFYRLAVVGRQRRYVAFPTAEVAIPRNFFVLRPIAELRPPPVASTEVSEVHAFTETYRKGVLMTMGSQFRCLNHRNQRLGSVSRALRQLCVASALRRRNRSKTGTSASPRELSGGYRINLPPLDIHVPARFGTLLSRATASLDYWRRHSAGLYFVIFTPPDPRGAPQSVRTHRP